MIDERKTQKSKDRKEQKRDTSYNESVTGKWFWWKKFWKRFWNYKKRLKYSISRETGTSYQQTSVHKDNLEQNI